MARFAMLFTVVIFALSAGFGCTPLEDKVCAHLGEFVDNGSYDLDECQGDIDRLKENCSNPEAVMECFLEKNSEDQMRSCEQFCEPNEEAE